MNIVMMRNNLSAYALTDLHTHILSAMDDGAKDLETSLEMLCRQKESGVERVMLTPHFYPQKECLGAFLERRQQAYQRLLSQWCGDIMPVLHLGAEVRYTPQLVEMDLRQLTLGQSDYLLLELPNMEWPVYIEQVLECMLQRGITPILAHVERCVYFRIEPERLKRLIDLGALAQVTAKMINSKDDQRFAKSCLENGLAHMIVSDIHSLPGENCLGNVVSQLDRALVERAEEFSRSVWDNTCSPAFSIYPVKKGLFGYR